MNLRVDETQMEEGAEAWWKSLTPATRGVFLQAVWEIEREPPPRERSDIPQEQPTV